MKKILCAAMLLTVAASSGCSFLGSTGDTLMIPFAWVANILG